MRGHLTVLHPQRPKPTPAVWLGRTCAHRACTQVEQSAAACDERKRRIKGMHRRQQSASAHPLGETVEFRYHHPVLAP